MKRFFLFVTLVLSVLAIGLPSSALASNVQRYQFSGQFAGAYFSSADPSNECIITDVSVFGDDGRVRMGSGKPGVGSAAGVYISQYDYCNEELLVAADGFTGLDADDFQIDRQLNSATLHTTITVYDWVSDTTYPVDVDVNWTGTGDPYRESGGSRYNTPGFKYNSHFQGTFRSAEVSGSVETAWGTLTSGSVVFADMGSVRSGSIEISH